VRNRRMRSDGRQRSRLLDRAATRLPRAEATLSTLSWYFATLSFRLGPVRPSWAGLPCCLGGRPTAFGAWSRRACNSGGSLGPEAWQASRQEGAGSWDYRRCAGERRNNGPTKLVPRPPPTVGHGAPGAAGAREIAVGPDAAQSGSPKLSPQPGAVSSEPATVQSRGGLCTEPNSCPSCIPKS
jgi:hypothetical protein